MSAQRTVLLQNIFDKLLQKDTDGVGSLSIPTISTNPLPPPHTEAFEIKMRKTFFYLQNALEYESNQWWDLSFLRKYLELGITPRGLRIQKQCDFLDQDLAKEWNLLSEFCTVKWIKLIIQQRERKLDFAKQRVMEKEEDLKQFESSCLYPKWRKTLESNVKKMEDKLVEKKIGKLERDIADYSRGHIHDWKRHMNNHDPPDPHATPKQKIENKTRVNGRNVVKKNNKTRNHNTRKPDRRPEAAIGTTQRNLRDRKEHSQINDDDGPRLKETEVPMEVKRTSVSSPPLGPTPKDSEHQPGTSTQSLSMTPTLMKGTAFSLPIQNRYSPLTRDLDMYISETQPTTTSRVSEDSSPFLGVPPKGPHKEKRKLEEVNEEEAIIRVNKKEKMETTKTTAL